MQLKSTALVLARANRPVLRGRGGVAKRHKHSPPARPGRASTPRTAIVVLTHLRDPEQKQAFARLAREADKYGTVVQVRHASGAGAGTAAAGCLTIADWELAQAAPYRFAQMQKADLVLTNGFVDIVMVAAARRLPGFDRYWFIEYDVDFSAPWSRFFSWFDTCNADLLCAALYPRHLSEHWVHWSWFDGPADARTSGIVRSFLPVARITRRLLEIYTAKSGRWSGHSEAVLPSIALHAGLSVRDMGGDGPMVLPAQRGRFYKFRTYKDPRDATFRASPTVATRYFSLGGQRLPRNYLWHPVKTAAFMSARRRQRGARPAYPTSPVWSDAAPTPTGL